VIYRSIANCIGNTPLVSLDKLFSDKNIQVYAKLEMLNPGGSVKDRPAKYIIEQGLRDGSIPKGAHLIESTSGNLGIALAMLCRVYGLKLTGRVPELLVREEIDDVIYVNDLESCDGCLDLLASEGIFAGGSSGSVVAAICKLIPEITPGSSILTLFPDRGDRYLDLVYSVEWRVQLKDSLQRRSNVKEPEVVRGWAEADQESASTVIL